MADDALERSLAAQSVGYLSKDDYKRKREEIEEEKAIQALKRRAGIAAPEVQPADGKKKKKKKEKGQQKGALSFGDELEEEAEGQSPGGLPHGGLSLAAVRAREEQQAAERQEAAMREVLQQQQRAKEELLTIEYTFRSEVTQRELPSSVHKGRVSVKRGLTADEVAVAVRTDVEKLGGKFAPNAVQGIREARDVMLIVSCEGMPTGSFIVPGAVSLVELSCRRWSDQRESTLFDDFRHGVVVIERRWYDRQRHTYPYSHWRLYDSRLGDDYSLKEFIATRNQKAQP
jgi:hypothetical protein